MTENTFQDWEAGQMKDPEFAKAWNELEPEYQAARIQQILAIPEMHALVEAANEIDAKMQELYAGDSGLPFALLELAKKLSFALAPFKEKA